MEPGGEERMLRGAEKDDWLVGGEESNCTVLCRMRRGDSEKAKIEFT